MIRLESVYKYPEALDILYALLRERSVEDDPHVNISHRRLPTFHDHERFVESRPYRYWYLILVEQSVVGTCYISKRNEIGIVLFRAHRGKGYGSQAVAALIEKHKPLKAIPGVRSGSFIANINPKNEASIRMFSRLGFTHLSNTYEL